jgi:hypothetical protein
MTMMLRVVGAGLGRTGTNSLKVALERLLGGRCYHMFELIERPGDTEQWERAVSGDAVEWGWLRQEFVATVDFPAGMFWRELLADSPHAVVLLSTRESAPVWWDSFQRTDRAVADWGRAGGPARMGPASGDEPIGALPAHAALA